MKIKNQDGTFTEECYKEATEIARHRYGNPTKQQISDILNGFCWNEISPVEQQRLTDLWQAEDESYPLPRVNAANDFWPFICDECYCRWQETTQDMALRTISPESRPCCAVELYCEHHLTRATFDPECGLWSMQWPVES